MSESEVLCDTIAEMNGGEKRMSQDYTGVEPHKRKLPKGQKPSDEKKYIPKKATIHY